MSHSYYSPSKSKLWLNCPAILNLSEDLPPEESSEVADEGSCAHAVGEHCILNKLLTVPKKLTDTEVPEAEKYFNPTMREHCQAYIDYIYDELRKARDISGHVVYGVEARLKIDWIEPKCGGTVDFFVGVPGRYLKVIDFKYGANVLVDAEMNTQGLIYALAVVGEDNPNRYKKVVIVIDQPRCTKVEKTRREFVITVKDLFKWRDKVLIPAIKNSKKKDVKPIAGEWCNHWCNVLKHGKCPAANKKALSVVASEFSTPAKVKMKNPGDASIEDLGKYLQMIGFLDKWKEGIKAKALELALKGETVPGFKLVRGRANRKWCNEKEMTEELGMFYEDDEIFNKKVKSPAQMEKMIGKSNYGIIEKHIIKPEGGLVLVPEGDRRKEIKEFDPAEEFGKIEK